MIFTVFFEFSGRKFKKDVEAENYGQAEAIVKNYIWNNIKFYPELSKQKTSGEMFGEGKDIMDFIMGLKNK